MTSLYNFFFSPDWSGWPFFVLLETFKVHQQFLRPFCVLPHQLLEHNKLYPNHQHRDKETVVPEGGSLLATQKASHSSSDSGSFFFVNVLSRMIFPPLRTDPTKHSIPHPTLLFFSFFPPGGWGSAREQHGPWPCRVCVCVCWFAL